MMFTKELFFILATPIVTFAHFRNKWTLSNVSFFSYIFKIVFQLYFFSFLTLLKRNLILKDDTQ